MYVSSYGLCVCISILVMWLQESTRAETTKSFYCQKSQNTYFTLTLNWHLCDWQTLTVLHGYTLNLVFSVFQKKHTDSPDKDPWGKGETKTYSLGGRTIINNPLIVARNISIQWAIFAKFFIKITQFVKTILSFKSVRGAGSVIGEVCGYSIKGRIFLWIPFLMLVYSLTGRCRHWLTSSCSQCCCKSSSCHPAETKETVVIKSSKARERG